METKLGVSEIRKEGEMKEGETEGAKERGSVQVMDTQPGRGRGRESGRESGRGRGLIPRGYEQ